MSGLFLSLLFIDDPGAGFIFNNFKKLTLIICCAPQKIEIIFRANSSASAFLAACTAQKNWFQDHQ